MESFLVSAESASGSVVVERPEAWGAYGTRAGHLKHLRIIVYLVALCVEPHLCLAQGKSGEVEAASSQENAIKAEALAALKLLHENQLTRLYRDKFADLQKRSLMTTEAKAISILTPIAQASPGGPAERTVLFLRSMDKMSTLFPDEKGEFYVVVFLAKYADSKYQETVWLVKEQSAWKIVAISIVRAL